MFDNQLFVFLHHGQVTLVGIPRKKSKKKNPRRHRSHLTSSESKSFNSSKGFFFGIWKRRMLVLVVTNFKS